jgi:two-component system, NtrC family, sensor kinase
LNPSHETLRAAIEASGAACVALARNGAILFYDRRFLEHWLVPDEVFASRTSSEVVDWLRAHGHAGAKALADLLSADDPPDEGELESTSGRTLRFRWAAVGGDLGRAWAFVDVSEREHLAAGLRDAGELLRVLEAHTDGAILEVDADVRVVAQWSTKERPYDGLAEPTLQGGRLGELVGGSPGAKVDALVREVFATAEPRSMEYSVEEKGTRRVFAADARLMPSADGEPARVTVMFRDVTERARMQIQLLETERLASFGLLAAGVAHEVNNPLAYVLLNLERIEKGLRRLADGAPLDIARELLDGVGLCLEGGRRVQQIVSDLRRFSRADAREPNLPIDVRRVLDFAIDMAGHEVHKRARVVREFDEVPLVSASENRLIQVFLNLLVNAAHAIGEGAPTENEIRAVTKTDEHGRALIEIYDTGEGMAPTVMQRIFEPFYTTKPAGVGTGLGLAICRDIAASLGGDIAVESEPGRGTVFRVLLPAA